MGNYYKVQLKKPKVFFDHVFYVFYNEKTD